MFKKTIAAIAVAGLVGMGSTAALAKVPSGLPIVGAGLGAAAVISTVAPAAVGASIVATTTTVATGGAFLPIVGGGAGYVWTPTYSTSTVLTAGATSMGALVPLAAFAVVGAAMGLAVLSTRGVDATLWMNPLYAQSLGYKLPSGPLKPVLKTDVYAQLNG